MAETPPSRPPTPDGRQVKISVPARPSNVIVLLAADTRDEAGGVLFFASSVGVDEAKESGGCSRHLARRFEDRRGEVAGDAVVAPGAGEPRGQEAGIDRLAAGGMVFRHGVRARWRAGGRGQLRRGPRRRGGASRARSWRYASDGKSLGPPVPGKQPIHAEDRSPQCARPQAVRTCPNPD